MGGSLSHRTKAVSTSSSPSSFPSSSVSFSSTTPSKSTTPTSVTLTTTEVIGPTATLYRDCPSSNDTLYSTTIGEQTYTFRKYCNLGIDGTLDGGNNVVNMPVNSFDACLDACAQYNNANATEILASSSLPCSVVCWRNSVVGEEFPGQCFGSTVLNSSGGGFQFSSATDCDSAGLINQQF